MKGIITRKRAIQEAKRAALRRDRYTSIKLAFIESLRRQGYGLTRARLTADRVYRIDSIPECELPQRIPLEALEE